MQSAKIHLFINHEHVAKVLACRRQMGIGESFKPLPWFRRRDARGRFAGGQSRG